MAAEFHGINVGFGSTKYYIIDSKGNGRGVTIPSLVAPAGDEIGGMAKVQMAEVDGQKFWTGADAVDSPNQMSIMSEDRLSHPHFIPALVRTALENLDRPLDGGRTGYVAHGIAGLPATWTRNPGYAKALGQRLRDAWCYYGKLGVIAEPLALAYGVFLDNTGRVVDDVLTSTILVVDIGHNTVDACVLKNGKVDGATLQTWNLGSRVPLGLVAARLGGELGETLNLHEVDDIVRNECITVRGIAQTLPDGWDEPLIANGQNIVTKLVEVWGKALRIDKVVIGGGGANQHRYTTHIIEQYPHTVVAEDPQEAPARGMARRAVMIGASG